jgi:aspartate aminotransferase
MFSNLPSPNLDPILSLAQAFRSDPRSEKVDLGIGVYKNSDGHTPVMQAVTKAQDIVFEKEKTKSYVGLAGCEEFNGLIRNLVLGSSVDPERTTTIQTPGASGALRMLGDLVKAAKPETTVWISDPSYVNHRPVMEAAGLKVRHYCYFDRETKQVNLDKMMSDLAQAGSEDIVLLHGSCHNPTGADIDFDAWKLITKMSLKNGFVPFVDVAYQGFGDGLIQDVEGVRYMASNVEEMLITTSCSKSFGLYRERAGAAIVVSNSQSQANNVKGKMLTLARATYTFPPAHGAELVKTILSSEELTFCWENELVQMRQRLMSLRGALCEELRITHNTLKFDFIEKHKGMFTMLGFSQEQMTVLKDKYGVYGVGDGRINIAGLTEKDIPYVAEAIIKVA